MLRLSSSSRVQVPVGIYERFTSTLVLGLAHKNAGWVASTTVFEVLFWVIH